jgi:hypothetical protein
MKVRSVHCLWGSSLALVTLVACERAGNVVASVDGESLTVEDAARLFAPFEGFASDPASVRAIAELWIDYTVLAEAVLEDSVLTSFDLDAVGEQQDRQRRVLNLRDLVITVDTTFTDGELRERFEREDPAREIRARHILVSPVPDATPAQRDSTRLYVEEIRARALGGEDFAQLAIAFSVDGSAPDGGDLGFFRRGQMVPEFEEVAFSLEPGEVSEVVETQFGFHIIKVEEVRRPEFEEVRIEYLRALQAQARQEAEGEYIAELERAAAVTLAPNAPDVIRAIAENPWRPLEASETAEPLAQWAGGELTAEEIYEYLRSQPREVLDQVRASAGAGWEDLLRNFVRQEILVARADSLGVESAEAEWELSEPILHQQLVSNSHSLGLAPLAPEPEESTNEAVRRVVERAITGNLSGEIGLLPLGAAIGPLRTRRDIRVYPETFAAVLARVADIRAAPGFEPYRREPATTVPAPDSALPAGEPSAPPAP